MALFLGYDVLLDQPNRIDDLDEEVKRSLERLDFGTGAITIDPRSDSPLWGRGFEWLLEGREEITRFKEWFNLRSGKLVPFWVPTWQTDLELIKDIAPTDEQIFVKNIGYGKFYALHPARKRFFFLYHNGTYFIKTLTGFSQNASDTEILAIDSSFGQNLKANRFLMISFLTFVRLASDDLEIFWHNKDLATVKARFIELPREVAKL